MPQPEDTPCAHVIPSFHRSSCLRAASSRSFNLIKCLPHPPTVQDRRHHRTVLIFNIKTKAPCQPLSRWSMLTYMLSYMNAPHTVYQSQNYALNTYALLFSMLPGHTQVLEWEQLVRRSFHVALSLLFPAVVMPWNLWRLAPWKTRRVVGSSGRHSCALKPYMVWYWEKQLRSLFMHSTALHCRHWCMERRWSFIMLHMTQRRLVHGSG